MSQQYQKQKLKWKEQGRKEREDEIIELIKGYFDGKIHKSPNEYIDLIEQIEEQKE